MLILSLLAIFLTFLFMFCSLIVNYCLSFFIFLSFWHSFSHISHIFSSLAHFSLIFHIVLFLIFLSGHFSLMFFLHFWHFFPPYITQWARFVDLSRKFRLLSWCRPYYYLLLSPFPAPGQHRFNLSPPWPLTCFISRYFNVNMNHAADFGRRRGHHRSSRSAPSPPSPRPDGF